MSNPSIVFAFFIASLLGALYHLIRGGGLGKLILYLFFSWIGFGLGHLVGIWQDWSLFPMGELNFGISVPGSLLLLVTGDWISRLGTSESQTYPDRKNGV